MTNAKLFDFCSNTGFPSIFVFLGQEMDFFAAVKQPNKLDDYVYAYFYACALRHYFMHNGLKNYPNGADNTIHWINHSPDDDNTCLLENDLTRG